MTGNSRDFYEGDALRETYDVDWTMAKAAHGLGRFVQQMQKQVLCVRDISIEELLAEVDEVKEEIWAQHQLVYGTFDY